MFHLYSWRNKQYAETTTLPRYSSLRPRSLYAILQKLRNCHQMYRLSKGLIMERNPGATVSPVRQRPFTIRQRRGFWRLLRANLSDLALLLRQSWFTLMLFGIVLVVGTVYEYQHGHPEVTPALYNTLQLLI